MGETTAGTSTLVIVVPETWTVVVFEMAPDVAVIVMTRIERSSPALRVAVTTPVALVLTSPAVTTPPLSAPIVTGAEDTVLRVASMAVTVIVTEPLAVFGKRAELAVTIRSAAALVPAPVPPLPEPPPPKGDVPSLPPPPPQAARPSETSHTKVCRSIFIL